MYNYFRSYEHTFKNSQAADPINISPDPITEVERKPQKWFFTNLGERIMSYSYVIFLYFLIHHFIDSLISYSGVTYTLRIH